MRRDTGCPLLEMGAEAVQAVALPDGRALAFKIVDDGATRALGPVLARAVFLDAIPDPLQNRPRPPDRRRH